MHLRSLPRRLCTLEPPLRTNKRRVTFIHPLEAARRLILLQTLLKQIFGLVLERPRTILIVQPVNLSLKLSSLNKWNRWKQRRKHIALAAMFYNDFTRLSTYQSCTINRLISVELNLPHQSYYQRRFKF